MSRSHRPSHQTSHETFQGPINQVKNQLSDDRFSPLEELKKRCSLGAAFDPLARSGSLRCAESTRLGIIQTIEEWVNSEGDRAVPSSLFWLYGGAGVGKSALAQSLSEIFYERSQLAASFFFCRGERNRVDAVIPTLVSQLVDAFEGLVPFVEDEIRRDPAVFAKECQVQIQELLISPLLSLKSIAKGTLNLPRLIVIDGLDECMNSDEQCQLLLVIARAIPQIPYPLRFLVTSRPEAHLAHLFHDDRDLQAIAHRYNVSNHLDVDMDIRKFLEIEFMDIRRFHSLAPHLPDAWPGPKAISSIVERSSGLFLYASTVIRYIKSSKNRPDVQLDAILRPGLFHDQPNTGVDVLYTSIFDRIKSRTQLEKICLVLAILYFQGHRPFVITIEELLQMETADLFLLLDPIRSLVTLDGGNIRAFHASIFDFLLDSTRRRHLPFDLSRVHESAATFILKQKIIPKACNMDDVLNFAYHCQYAYLTDTLRNYLRSMDDPYRVVTEASSRHAFLDEFVQSMAIWHLFRTLNREDFDSTGQFYEQCMSKWRNHRSKSWLKLKLEKLLTKFPNSETVVLDGLKHELDTLLSEWKPQNFTAGDLKGMDPVRRVALIKQEHSVLSANANTNTILSLVIGDYFIHRYSLEFREDGLMLLTLQTYSVHDNKSYQEGQVGQLGTVVQETLAYLKRVEKYLFSDFYQKYGFQPDGNDDEMELGCDYEPALSRLPSRNKFSLYHSPFVILAFVFFTCCSLFLSGTVAVHSFFNK